MSQALRTRLHPASASPNPIPRDSVPPVPRMRVSPEIPARRSLRTSTSCAGPAPPYGCSARAKQESARGRTARSQVARSMISGRAAHHRYRELKADMSENYLLGHRHGSARLRERAAPRAAPAIPAPPTLMTRRASLPASQLAYPPLSVSGPAYRIPRPRLDDIGVLLLQAAAELETALSDRAHPPRWRRTPRRTPPRASGAHPNFLPHCRP